VTWRAEPTRQVPAASHRLPSLALGAAGGGRLAVDTRDSEGLTSVAKFFSVDLVLPGAARTGRIGGRALVRFEHEPEPLIARVTRAVRRLFLRELRV
jgi:putative peptide zinc metalloprotease protein